MSVFGFELLEAPQGGQRYKIRSKALFGTLASLPLPIPLLVIYPRGGADKSLARPGRKQTTATKLGIYSTYSPRSSVHFLALCSNFCEQLKENFRWLSVQRGLRASNDRVGRIIAIFQFFFFQYREQVVVRRVQIRRRGWVIKTLEAQGGQFLMGCKRPVTRGIVVQEKEPLGDLP